MKADAVLLMLIVLRYGYEKKPLQYALLKGWLETNPTFLPENYRTAKGVVDLIDVSLNAALLAGLSNQRTSVRIEDPQDPVRLLREFAARFN